MIEHSLFHLISPSGLLAILSFSGAYSKAVVLKGGWGAAFLSRGSMAMPGDIFDFHGLMEVLLSSTW